MESPVRGGGDLPDVKLIETLGWDGTAFARLPLHLARLAAGVACLGLACDPQAAARALRAAVGSEPSRVRLTLDGAGRLEVTAAPLPPSPPLWRLTPALAPLASADPWLRLKSTRRAAYDAARAALPPWSDEAIFSNERDEVCDGSITTLFFDAGAGLCTPPVTCGLLPGVLRAQLLLEGKAREAVLAAADLPRVKLWVGNSLRGLMPAVWVG
ncbi:aminotransferase class IV [Paracoccaceae bacterium Fryx2]|nr:aminotransferase class IV [Paracoccaceae bacterium Fryx2]